MRKRTGEEAFNLFDNKLSWWLRWFSHCFHAVTWLLSTAAQLLISQTIWLQKPCVAVLNLTLLRRVRRRSWLPPGWRSPKRFTPQPSCSSSSEMPFNLRLQHHLTVHPPGQRRQRCARNAASALLLFRTQPCHSIRWLPSPLTTTRRGHKRSVLRRLRALCFPRATAPQEARLPQTGKGSFCRVAQAEGPPVVPHRPHCYRRAQQAGSRTSRPCEDYSFACT